MIIKALDGGSDLLGAKGEPLLEVLSGRVAVLSRGRNAWHSTWARHYQAAPEGTAMFSTPDSAKAHAERRRERGSQFYVNEAPALLLRGVTSTVLLCDFHPADPFKGWSPRRDRESQSVLTPGVPLVDVLQSFEQWSGHWSYPWRRSEHSLLRGRLFDHRNLQPLGGKPLAAWRSQAQGSRFLLAWYPRPTRFTRRGTNAQVRAFRREAEKIPGYLDAVAASNRLQEGLTLATDQDQATVNAAALAEIRDSLAAMVAR